MKSLLLLTFSFGLIGVAIGQQVLFSEDFKHYNTKQNVGAQSPFITTWSSVSVDEALIGQDQALSGSQSIKIDGLGDLIIPFNDFTTRT